VAPVNVTAASAAVETAVSQAARPRRLRVGLFVDARLQPRWAIEAFAKAARSEFAEIALIAILEEGRRERHDSPAMRWYSKLDRWAFRVRDPAELVDIAEALQQKITYFYDPKTAARDLDVAFALGEFDDSVLDGVARYGVWRFYFGDGGATGGSGGTPGAGEALAGWLEVAEGAPLSASGLKARLASDGPARLAYQSWSRTYPFSVARNRAELLLKTSEFVCRALRELQRNGAGWLEQCRLENRGQAPISQSESGTIGNRSLTPIFSRILRRGVEKALNVEQWFLAYRLREGRFGDARAIPADLKGYTKLLPPKDRYWADPFVLTKSGHYFVFFEELPFATGKAHISMLEIDAEGRAGKPVRVLERDYHLSYPFLVEHEGQLYMIPETAQNGTVEAYRCVDFPLRWRLERVLLSGIRCVDATFHRGPDRWWMFANVAAAEARMFDDELHIFHADDLMGDWQPHRRNPVKSDARCARPAGQLYWREGNLYRPAQICAPLYGSGLSINRVLRLTPHDYAERQVERILPSRRDGLLGLHTINRAGDLTVVDAFTRRPRF
jgi:hypothetical protein